MKTKTILTKSAIKYIQSLGQKKFRESEGVFVAEGPKIINELLKANNTELVNLYAPKQWWEENPVVIHSLQAQQLTEISHDELQRISFLSTPNQALAVFKKPSFREINFDNKISLILDNIQDPGNLGTIIRIADWFGVQQVVCSVDSVDVFNPKTVQSTMGSVSRVRVLYDDIKSFIISHPGLPAYAAMLDGSNVYEMKRIKEGLIVIGNESKGISEDILSLIKNRVTIPGSGNAESLNAAVATGIILSHLIK
jgi:RNA methyltransferase, TrmH family